MEQTHKELEEYAKKRADEVYDISIDELRALVIDGANWAFNKLKEDYEVNPTKEILDLQEQMKNKK